MIKRWRYYQSMIRLSLVLTISILFLLVIAPSFLTPFYVRVLLLFFLFAGLATSWNILGGFAGYWSFGHTVFIGVASFMAGKLLPLILINQHKLLSLLLCLIIGSVASALLALLLAYPMLRVRGIYFAIAMLGVSELVTELTSNIPAIDGALGVVIPTLTPHGIDPVVFFYYLLLTVAAMTLGVAAWIKSSRFGYGLASIREDEDTAKMLGVPTERYKIIALVISGGLVGLLGVIYGFSLGFFTTYSVFRMDFSLNMILHCLIGGIGTLVGPLLGAGIMVFLTQVILGRLLDIHLLITGLLIIAIVLLAPSGIVGTLKAWNEKRYARGKEETDQEHHTGLHL
jgi:branched-chain amino acid transport system permease protein